MGHRDGNARFRQGSGYNRGPSHMHWGGHRDGAIISGFTDPKLEIGAASGEKLEPLLLPVLSEGIMTEHSIGRLATYDIPLITG